MPRIGDRIVGFEQQLLTQLHRLRLSALDSSLKLSTGKKFNAPKDNPSAFLQISKFEEQLNRVNAVKSNVEVAAVVGAESQTTLEEIRTQLNTIRSALLADEGGTLTTSQRLEKQAIIDTAIADIRTLARTSSGDKRYLDGSFNYSVTGRDPAQIKNVEVFSLADDTTISGNVTTAATQSTLDYTGVANKISASATFTLTGKRGSSTFSVTILEDLTTVRDRINAQSHKTGITSSVSGNTLTFRTVDYGTAATIDLDVTSGTFNTTNAVSGADAVVTINGESVSADDIDGNLVSFRDNGVNAAIDLTAGFSGAFSTITLSDDHVARFSLSLHTPTQTKFGLPGLFPELLGGISGEISDLETGGTLAGLGTNVSRALRVVDEALGQLYQVEGRIDAFADVAVASAERLMDGFGDKLQESIDALNLVDEDEETLVLTKKQALADSTVSALSIMQQFRSSVLNLLNELAGF